MNTSSITEATKVKLSQVRFVYFALLSLTGDRDWQRHGQISSIVAFPEVRGVT